MTTALPATAAITVILSTPDDTDRLGILLCQHLRQGDTLLLAGPIGAGKSHLARSIIREFLLRNGAPQEEIPSPTYTLVQTYDCGPCEIWHADLYRLSGPDEIPELGLDAAFAEAVCLVEWPDRLGDFSPDSALRIDLAAGPDGTGRCAALSWTDRRWGDLPAWLSEMTGDRA